MDKIKNGNDLLCKLSDYVTSCENKRLPNSAGFCRYLEIDRAVFTELAKTYPSEFDRMLLTFTDEALNCKIPNTGPTMGYIKSINDLSEGGDAKSPESDNAFLDSDIMNSAAYIDGV
jgi:hypothetical protein